jgi:NAD(P)H-dependent FMN reductase
MIDLKVILGSTRQGRAADHIMPWLLERVRQHGQLNAELLDLRDWPLPFFSETMASIGDMANPIYSQPIVHKWNKKIGEGDAFLFVTPEYNHSVPGVLKNAVDSVFVSFALRNKPAGFVGYSGGSVGGARAVEHLVQICFEAEMVTLRNTVLFPMIHQAFGPDGQPNNPAAAPSLAATLDDLAWWGGLLKTARPTQLPPARLRAKRG